MKFETKATDKYASVFFKIRLPFGKTFHLHSILFNSPDTYVLGYSSRTLNGRYVLFMDYDNLELPTVVEELKYLQNKFKLSEFYVFSTGREGAYHAVCLDVMPMQEAYEILKQSSCDLSFIHAIKNLEYREWVLRIGTKGERSPPKFWLAVPSKHHERMRSSAHAAFIRKMFRVRIQYPKLSPWDKLKNLGVVKYNTANRVKNSGADGQP